MFQECKFLAGAGERNQGNHLYEQWERRKNVKTVKNVVGK